MFDDPKFLAKLEGIEKRHDEVTEMLGRPDVIANRAEFQKLSREHAHLSLGLSTRGQTAGCSLRR